MKQTDIEAGAFYYDGKGALREVLSIAKDGAKTVRVHYRILAAKISQRFSYTENKMVSLINVDSSCHIESFATWAKSKLTKQECAALLQSLEKNERTRQEVNMTARLISST